MGAAWWAVWKHSRAVLLVDDSPQALEVIVDHVGQDDDVVVVALRILSPPLPRRSSIPCP